MTPHIAVPRPTTVAVAACSPESLKSVHLSGAVIDNISAFEVHNYSYIDELGSYAGNIAKNYTDLNFCNVSITYSHEDQDDSIHVNVWLPLSKKDWNGRFQGTGGGGFATGEGTIFLAPALGQGYSTAETDGGHAEDNVFGRPEYWALDKDGQVNEQLLLDFAHVSLNDMTVLGKAVTEAYYGEAPHHSYWHGCSTGGRQGLAMAQRYPDAYDGILALSPAIYWARAIVAEYWGQLIMNHFNYYPPPCEFEAITAAAIKACDGLDGVIDGIISLPEMCNFDAESLVGSSFNCSGTELRFSSEATVVASAMWKGARNSTSGSFEWHGLDKDASFLGLVDTNCTDPTNASTCTGVPFPVVSDWLQYFVFKDPDYDLTKLSYLDFDAAIEKSIEEYGDLMNTSNADLSAFRAAGGKMITTQGLADSLIFPKATTSYYDEVLHRDSDAQDFYRLFLLPGVVHCYSVGPGPYPVDQLEALTRWVEEGDAPDTLTTSFRLTPSGGDGERRACVYPAVQTYIGGDPLEASSFACK